jgi:phage/conjugal plasmid C-4 type zinc finger TraR family protein
MADLTDIAQERIERELDAKLATMRIAQNKNSEQFCLSCGNDIPEKRRIAIPGVQLCVGCKEVEEAHKRNHR